MHKRPHEKLIAWQESYKLALWIYKLTGKFPACERFSLVNQMRRSAYSVPTNIAEGNVRTGKDKRHFFIISTSSLEELHCQCMLSRDLGYITSEAFEKTNDHIQRTSFLINKLHSAVRV